MIGTQVFHYGRFEGTEQGCGIGFKEEETVSLEVDAVKTEVPAALKQTAGISFHFSIYQFCWIPVVDQTTVLCLCSL